MQIPHLLDVNPLLMDRVRLAIMVKLALAGEPVDFNTLLETLHLTKGNLSTHLSKLEAAALITVSKAFVGKKPKSTYCCNEQGKAAMQQYLSAVESVLKTVA